ncbi:uncharacterized protein LOC127453264 [Myxocyprinus asiaticus]|uniref:uncharacterized protein LOC127453264 n=1 Tax=Myxocyprinus asiaticus TaxID=70543 RepID=UPI0022217CBB|nr:uncharacterized protein LOC127453264 [Myxocyprinus asiaticus]XP_051575459.1 uncharacterized protein LOC127453264 [Myxocyprinus asiaticus]
MHPSSRPSVPPRSRRFDKRRPEAKSSQGTKRVDKKLSTASSSPRLGTRGPAESFRLKGPSQGARAPVVQAKFVRPQKNAARAIPAKPKSGRTVSNLDVDPNCNEPSLPCLCCDGHSPQDSNSLYNHNHNNNNTVTIRQQMKTAPPPPPHKDKLAVLKQDVKEDEGKLEINQPHAIPVEEKEEENGNVDEKDGAGLKNNDKSINVNDDVDVNGNGNGDGDNDDDDEDDDDDDDDTLVPSCCNCPESMLAFSLTSSTSSSTTSISSCSDLECDCPDTFSLSSQDHEAPECYPSTHSPASHSPNFQTNILPLDLNTSVRPRISHCSSDEGYPSAPSSPSSDFSENKASEKVDLLNFIDSMEELGKVDLFYRIVQIAHWVLDSELIVKDRLDHQQKLQRVNKEVKLNYLVKLQEEGFDFDDKDITGLLDEMGNIDIPWKLYKSNKSCDSQEFSDAGVDLTAPSDLDETPLPDSLAPSPLDLPPPPRPPKPPKRHVSAHPESHMYKTISGHTFAVSSNNNATPFSISVSVPPLPQLSSSPTASKPHTLPPPPSQPVPYFTLNTDSTTLTSPTPPIPPPRRRHKARLEAQRLAELEKENTPQSLPPPTSRPPPLPPPPALSPPPAIPPPPSLPPPPTFHALDVEIRKLLALAGLTQAELLKLSPEFGVSVDVVLGNDQEAISDVSQEGEIRVNRTQKDNKEVVDEGLNSRLREGTRFSKDRSTCLKELDILNKKDDSKNEQKEANRTMSFIEMARRRKKNGGNCNNSCSCGFGTNVTLSPCSYYSTDLSNTNIPNVSFGNFDYTLVMSDTPPPPLPPRPPVVSNSSELPPLKPCTLPANAFRPDRFDWLIAFTPDAESPPLEMQKSSNDGMLHKETSGSKVTTFKELRNKSKKSFPTAPVQPEPDPTIITPDPDFLYNLKWRKEKIDGDGWEYTSQAQASFLQPPPTPASLSLFREMCHLNIQEDCPADLSSKTSQQIGCSVSEGSLKTICGEREKEGHTKKTEDEAKVEVRGMADGAWTLESRTTAVRSFSFAGFDQKNVAWIGDDVRPSLKPDGLSSACLQEKRTFVNAVSLAVEAILAQFSSSRTVVQKALSGDSSVNPSLGRLVLQCLCPALRSLLCDGLKPHQSDLITGRRTNSPWRLVQAFTKPGPGTQALHSLQTKVAGLPQLKLSRHRFNAFLFGLLNIKLLDYWFSHLQSCSDVLETYYRPTSFMRLSLTSCQPLFEELLLLLQPLSLLTFNLDLLFQHHHLDPTSPTLSPASHSPEKYSPPNEDFSFHLSPKGLFQGSGHHLGSILEQDHGGLYLQGANPNAGITSLPSQVLDVFEESAYRNPIVLSSGVTKVVASSPLSWFKGREISAPLSGESGASFSQQAGQALQQGWGAVMRLGERLGQNFGLANSNSTEDVKAPNSTDDSKTGFSLNPKSPVGNSQQPRTVELSMWDSGAAVPWGMGRLFGASKSPNNPPPSRRPSQWLSSGVSVLTHIVNIGQRSPSEKRELQKSKEDKNEKRKETGDQPRLLRVVRTLCDHTGIGTELSFRKGEELVLLGGVDHDWIRCRQGDKEGLVPIGYASLVM